MDFACSTGSATNLLCNAGTPYSLQKVSESHQELKQWKAQINKRHLLVRRPAISDIDGAFRSGGSLGDDSSLLEEGRQSGREASSSSQLHEEAAPPSVSWRKAFMYTAVTTAANAETCSEEFSDLTLCLPDAEDQCRHRRMFSDADLARGRDGEEAGRDGAGDEAGAADAGEHAEGRRAPRLRHPVCLQQARKCSVRFIASVR